MDADSFILNTASGARIDLSDPDPASIRIADVAGALSRICRFGAQIEQFYSVAEHALLVSRLVVEAGRPDLALAALHHDSHEAYICDLPTPVKRCLGDSLSEYRLLGDRLDDAIAAALGFPRPRNDLDEAVIKRADRRALLAEAALLVHDRGDGIRQTLRAEGIDLLTLEPVPDLSNVSLGPPDAAAEAFLAAHAALAVPA